MLAPKDWRKAIALNGRHPVWVLAGPSAFLILNLVSQIARPEPWYFALMPVAIFTSGIAIWWVSPSCRKMSVVAVMLPAGLSLVAGLILIIKGQHNAGFSTSTNFMGLTFSQFMVALNSDEALTKR